MDRRSWCGRTWCPRGWDTMIKGDNWRISRVLFWLRGTMIMAPVRSPAYHQRSYVEKRGATVENLLEPDLEFEGLALES